IRIGDRALAEFLLFLPYVSSGFQVLAGPSFAVRMAINKVAHADHPAMMVLHYLVRVDLLGRELPAAGIDSKQVASDPITGTHVHQIVLHNGRRDHRSRSSSRCAP